MQTLTFDELPKAVAKISADLHELRQLIVASQQHPNPTKEAQDEFLTVEQAAELLHLRVPTIYSKVSRRELPVMRTGKRLFFSRAELLEYIKSGRRKTVSDIENEIDSYSSTLKDADHG